MTQPPTDYALLDDLKDELGIKTTEVDNRLLRAITTSSRVVDTICRVDPGTFVPQTLTKYFDVSPQVAQRHFPISIAVQFDNYITDNTRGYTENLRIPPCLSISTLKTDENGDGVYEVTWTEGTDFFTEPYNLEVKRRISVNADLGRYGFPAGQRRVQIAGSWGITELGLTPMGITRSVYLLAGRYYRRPEALFAMLGNPEVGFQRISSTDPDVAALLEKWGGAYRNQWIVA